MKRGSFFLLLFFYACTVQAQANNPDEIVRKVFASLQAKDENAFLALCPDSAQLVQIMKRLAQGVIADIKSGLPKDFSRRSMASFDKSLDPIRESLKKTYAPKEIQKRRNSFRENFCRILEDGEKRGVDWATATFTNFTFDSIKNGSFLYGQSLPKHSSFQSMRGKIYFKDRDSTCQVWVEDLTFIPTENRWYVGTLEMLVLAGDKADEIEITDVVVQSIQDEAPPPPPPLHKRKKSKTSSAKKSRALKY